MKQPADGIAVAQDIWKRVPGGPSIVPVEVLSRVLKLVDHVWSGLRPLQDLTEVVEYLRRCSLDRYQSLVLHLLCGVSITR